MAINTIFNTDVQGAIECVTASDGVIVPIGQLAHTYGRDGSGNLTTDTVVFNGVTYIQTATYNGSNQQTAVSVWVKQ